MTSKRGSLLAAEDYGSLHAAIVAANSSSGSSTINAFSHSANFLVLA